MEKTKEQLLDLIRHSEFKIRQYSNEKLHSERAQKMFYRNLIEKAVYKKELENLSRNEFIEFVKRGVRKFKNKKLICDSF